MFDYNWCIAEVQDALEEIETQQSRLGWHVAEDFPMNRLAAASGILHVSVAFLGLLNGVSRAFEMY